MTGRGSVAEGRAAAVRGRLDARVRARRRSRSRATAAPPPPDAAELDPSAPLAPMPDLGVDWPDLNAKDTHRRRAPRRTRRPADDAASDRATSGEIRYTLDDRRPRRRRRCRGAAEGVPAAVGARGRPQGPGQRRADRPPLARRRRPARASCCAARAIMMRSSSRAPSARGDGLRVVLAAEPGQQYRFASVELPGLDAAGAEAAKLRNAFAVKAGDPVIAAGCDRRRASRSRRRSASRASPSAKVGEQEIEVNHQTHLATLVLPVDPGPVARVRRDPGQRPAAVQRAACRRSIARFKRGDPFKRSKVDDLRRALIATSLGRQRRHPGRAGRRRADGRPRRAARARAVAHDRRRARLRHRAGRAASRRAGPTAISSIPKAR